MSYLDDLKYEAIAKARKLRHATVTVEHLLWALLESNDAEFEKALSIPVTKIKHQSKALNSVR